MTAAGTWSTIAIDRLTRATACPVCDAATLADHRCATCGADFSTVGAELWAASVAAASALQARQAVLDRVPRTSSPAVVAGPSAPAGGPAGAASSPAPSRPVPPPPARDPRGPRGDSAPSATVQSVLAVAGAGLVAVAAVVFTFFNPDLADRGARTAVVGVVAVAFLAGAWMLSRRSLAFSAEAVGAVGMVFVALAIGSAADAGAPRAAWATAATGALVAGAAMAGLGWLVRLRTWLWTALVALVAVPALYGAAAGGQTAITVGALASAVVALVLVAAAARLGRRLGSALTVERVSLTVAQAIAALLALVSSALTVVDGTAPYWLGNAVVLTVCAAIAAASARHPAGLAWMFGAGASGAAAATLLALAAGVTLPAVWLLALLPVAAAVGAALVAAAVPTPPGAHRTMLLGGALAVVGVVTTPAVMVGLAIGAATLLDRLVGDTDLRADTSAAVALGLAGVGAALTVVPAVDRRRREATATPATGWLGWVALWLAAAAALVALCSPGIAPAAQATLALLAAAPTSIALAAVPRVRAARLAVRLPLIVGAHTAVLLAGALALRDDALIVPLGAGVVVGVLIAGRAVRRSARFVHTAVAYAYGLLVMGAALGVAGAAPPALLCLVTAAGGLFAIAVTFVERVRPRHWWAILAVTSAPFVAGVVQVVFERSGWTALSTGVIFLLALALTVTRRQGLGRVLRAVAAGMLVPSLSVVAVCLGAQLLVTSGSPVVLPVIASIVALVLPARRLIQDALAARIGPTDADVAALAIESSALLTGAIAVGLALAREAAGLSTTLLVLLIIAVGAAATARWARRRYGWWVCAAALTGALWCAWGLAGVSLAEPYVLPPAIGAALAGAILTARGARALPLFATGLALAVVPVLALLAATGTPGATAWRAYGLVTASVVLVAATALFGTARARAGLGALRPATLAVAVAAGAAGTVQAARWGLGADAAPSTTMPLVVLGLGLGVAGALPAGVAVRMLRPDVTAALARKALAALPVLFAVAAAWPAIEREWPTIWTMWALMLAVLAGMLAIAARGRRRSGSLPPVWVVFAIAFVTAVVAWSPRELRVEWFSLPLGLSLVAAGALATRSGEPRRLSDWPRGWQGSWATLAPGIVVTVSASIAATFTDPLTWRAILVIVLALAAIVIGAARRLAAPFVLGIVVLPVENALAFFVQIGRGIESMPWWITLSVVGAVLLVIAVTYECRSGEGAGFAARLRDLR